MANLCIFLILLMVIVVSATEHEQLTDVFFTSHNNINKLHFKAFGRQRRYVLQPASVVFTPGFRTFHADGETITPVKNVNVRSDSFFNLNRGKGSVHVERDTERVLVHGIIDDYMTIKPHPSGKHLIRWTREAKVSSADYIRPNAARKERAIPMDYIKPTYSKLSHNKHHKREADTVPNDATVEIFIAFDYRNSEKLNFDHKSIVRYLGIFWNAVSQRYATATSPTVSLAIAGLMTFSSAEAEPFITDNLGSGIQIESEKLLKAFKEWLGKQTDLPKHDTALLQTAVDSGTVYSNGEWVNDRTGLATLGGACKDQGEAAGYFEDKAPVFTGVQTAAHELAHNLNVPHDGEAEAANCPDTDGYIMAPSNGFTANTLIFSQCSLQIMNDYIRSDAGKCLWNAPQRDPEIPILTDKPVVMAGTLDEQCKVRYGDDSFEFVGKIDEKICLQMFCKKKGSTEEEKGGIGAPEGTPCGVQKVCVAGVCSPSGIPTLDEQCEAQAGSDFTAQNKYESNVCTDLKCANSNDIQSITAKDGSSCGNAGTCVNAQCLYQTPSLDEQCRRNDESRSAFVKNEADVCTKLWCGPDDASVLSWGPADENSSCGSGKVCRNKECVTQ